MWRKTCRECRSVFVAEKEWESKCIVCWKESKEMDLLAGDKQCRLLQKEIKRLEKENRHLLKQYRLQMDELNQKKSKQIASSDLNERVKDLLRLCHPDRHNNSDKAAEITRWLIDLRRDARA